MDDVLKDIAQQEYKDGFVTEVEQEYVPKGLSEEIIRLISSKRMSRSGCWTFVSTPTGAGSG